MRSTKDSQWLFDFGEFVQTKDAKVSPEMTTKVWKRTQPLISPNPMQVFLKLLGIHITVRFLSLSVCHQFEMNPFRTSGSLADVFNRYGGHSFCMIAYGVFFVGMTLISAGLVLTIEEFRALRRTEFVQTFGIGVLSLVGFVVFGVELVFAFAGLWLLGVLVGGFIATEAV